MYTLFTDSLFKGLPVTKAKGPLVAEYLDQIHALLCRALDHHRQLSTFRVELSVPQASTSAGQCPLPDVARLIERLEEKVRDLLPGAATECSRARSGFLRSLWAREHLPGSSSPRFSVIFLLNADVQRSGDGPLDCQGLIRLVVDLWAALLEIAPAEAQALVRIPPSEGGYIHAWDDATIEQFFLRASGLCKAGNKWPGDSTPFFGCSKG